MPMTTTTAPSSSPADASASPLPDVIRLTVKAQYDGEDWTDFSADKTAEEVAAALRGRYPHLASVTLDESGGWLRVIERPSWDAPVERYRLCGMDAGCIDSESSDDDLLHVRLVRLDCDDPGPEALADEDEQTDQAAMTAALDVLAAAPNERQEETNPVIATETPAAEAAADEMALAAASVPPKRSRKAPIAAPPAPGALAVTVAREPLRAALRIVVTAAASGRLIAAVTANVLIEATSEGLRLTCTDLSQRLSVEIAAIVGVDGAYTVPAKLLSQLVDTFTAPVVTLRQDGEVLRVTSGKSRGHLKGIDAAEFPVDRQDGGESCTLPAAVLRRALTLTRRPGPGRARRPGQCSAASASPRPVAHSWRKRPMAMSCPSGRCRWRACRIARRSCRAMRWRRWLGCWRDARAT
jgi:hypothetical protein